MAILLMRGARLALPHYLGSQYGSLDGCVANTARLVGRYDVVTHGDTSFLQIFLCERLGAIAPKATEFYSRDDSNNCWRSEKANAKRSGDPYSAWRWAR